MGALQFQMPVYGLYIWFLSLMVPSSLVIARKCKLNNYNNRCYLKVFFFFFVAVFLHNKNETTFFYNKVYSGVYHP